MQFVAKFLFDHGILGQGAPSADFVGVRIPGGKIVGDKSKVNLRFDTTYMEMAAAGSSDRSMRRAGPPPLFPPRAASPRSRREGQGAAMFSVVAISEHLLAYGQALRRALDAGRLAATRHEPRS